MERPVKRSSLQLSFVLGSWWTASLASLAQLRAFPLPTQAAPALEAEPDAASQKRAEAVVRDLLKADYAEARKSATGQQSLVKKLNQYGEGERSNASQRYVCFREARDIAARAGDWKSALEAIAAMASSFKVDSLAMKRTALDTSRRAARTPETWKALAQEYAVLLDEAIGLDRYETATVLAAEFASAAEKARDLNLITRANAMKREAREIKAEYDRIEKEREALAQDPGSSRASTAVGKFIFLMKEDAEKGLLLLARSLDPALSAIAERERSDPREAEAQVDLAERWWNLAEAETNILRIRMQKRAAYWYEEALPRLEGLGRARVEKRLDEYDAVAATAGPAQTVVYLSDLKEEDHHVGYGSLGKHGKLGYAANGNRSLTRTVVNGKEYQNSLSMVPPSNGTAYIQYDLQEKYRLLVSDVALVDGDGKAAATPVTFRALGDGRVLWTSSPVQKPKEVQKCKVRISGVKLLRLEIECPGWHNRAHSIWLEPQVIRR